jgi:hypothetical protein
MAQAAVGNLSGTFKAWLSTTTVNAATHLTTHSTGPYVLQDGITIVANNWADLTDGTLDHAIDQDESGNVSASGTGRTFGACTGGGTSGSSVFTDSATDGTFFSVSDCGGWTNATVFSSAINGDSFATGASWTEECATPCDLTSALYCIQQ